MLDGKIWQLLPGGKTREANDTDQIPFAVSTKFVAQQIKKVELRDKNAVDEVLDGFESHAKNLFMTYRIDGVFGGLKCRTVRGQE